MPQVITMMNKEMLYYINPEQQTPEELKALLEMHPEIKFVSFTFIVIFHLLIYLK